MHHGRSVSCWSRSRLGTPIIQFTGVLLQNHIIIVFCYVFFPSVFFCFVSLTFFFLFCAIMTGRFLGGAVFGEARISGALRRKRRNKHLQLALRVSASRLGSYPFHTGVPTLPVSYPPPHLYDTINVSYRSMILWYFIIPNTYTRIMQYHLKPALRVGESKVGSHPLYGSIPSLPM